jgi:FKBP-type peptidyl-prolyl cis-trans isomerase
MKNWSIFIGLCAFLINSVNASAVRQPILTLDSGLEYEDLRLGSGATVQFGAIVTIHITGWINEGGKKGIEFISTYNRGKPMSFKLGAKYVMKALNEGVRGMKVGGKRLLMVPEKLGYGAKGVGDVVPPNADLLFEVELIDAE